uniref:Retrotransposon gag domain-containing protein n=1 Tax=Chenopodium quinoa TaxID=63459 RepID=A0A803MA59_CHEQI
MALGSKNKFGFLEESISQPNSSSPDYNKWIRNDYLIYCWILRSIEPSLAEGFMFTTSTAELWDEIKHRHGKSNAPRLFDLLKQLIFVQQGDSCVAEYYNKLKKVWDQLQVLEEIPQCYCEYTSMDPLPTVLKAYHILQQVESQTSLNIVSLIPEVSALMSNRIPHLNAAMHVLRYLK